MQRRPPRDLRTCWQSAGLSACRCCSVIGSSTLCRYTIPKALQRTPEDSLLGQGFSALQSHVLCERYHHHHSHGWSYEILDYYQITGKTRAKALHHLMAGGQSAQCTLIQSQSLVKHSLLVGEGPCPCQRFLLAGPCKVVSQHERLKLS